MIFCTQWILSGAQCIENVIVRTTAKYFDGRYPKFSPISKFVEMIKMTAGNNIDFNLDRSTPWHRIKTSSISQDILSEINFIYIKEINILFV